jgi:regulatory protein
MKKEVSDLNKQLTEIDLINKIAKYCAYQDRCIDDLNKLYDKYKLVEPLRKKITQRMISEGFINEERYVRSYVFGKLRNNYWGKLKIAYALRQKDINNNLIQQIINEVEESEYVFLIFDLIHRKANSIKEVDPYIWKNKIARFLIQKGFESDLVWKSINSSETI